ncbi:MAG: type II toxin-antitoxin system VapC family toxin [Methylococcaceae bacterium]|nr:type II toxin-antitoxin system VapC family toxin [Methylococcaceae bacterium]
MLVFFDSSAFVKRYINESGTDQVLDWCDKATEIGLASIILPEIISAFCRLRRESKISEAQYRQLKSLLLTDIEDASLCDLAPTISALENNTLRAMDAIHIASAIIMKADIFISADKRQCEAAVQTGLRVESLF